MTKPPRRVAPLKTLPCGKQVCLMSEYTSLPWIRRTEVVTDGETLFVKVWFKDSDDIVVVPTSEFHRFAHRGMDHALEVERQQIDIEAEHADLQDRGGA